jgi:hypothetical protein
MSKRIPYELKVGSVAYRLAEKPAYGHGGSSRTPVQDSSGAEVEDAEEERIYLPRITGAQLIMKNHKLRTLQNTLSAGRLSVVLKIREGGAVSTFSLANTSCTTAEVVEQDGIVNLDFMGGTASGD